MLRHTILGLTLTPLAAAAEPQNSHFYTELDALYFSSPGDFESEQTMGLTLGYALDDQHSIEAELQVNGLDSMSQGFEADADLITYLVGYRYNISRQGDLRYFGGFGLGYSQAEFNTSPTIGAEQELTIGFLRAGVDYDINPHAYVSAEARYQYIPDLDKNGVLYGIGGVPVLGISAGYRF